MYITHCFSQDVLSEAYKAFNFMHVEFKTPVIYERQTYLSSRKLSKQVDKL